VKALCDAPVPLDSPVRLASRFGLIGRSEAFQRTLEQIELVADKSANVLICGETGVGKERVARAIHAAAARSAREMVTLNCAGIPATLLEDELFGHEKGAFTDAYQRRVGCFEQAAGSTIFLDEIGELPLELQPKLLRVLQEREIRRVGGAETVRVDARVVVATNVDLWKRVEERRFREDLFYRINVFPIRLPPLRERREDIPLFLDHFLERACTRERMPGKRLAPGVSEALCRRDWPGNVRQPENAAEMAVIRAQNRPVVDLGDFPPPRKSAVSSLTAQAGAAAIDFKSLVEHFERDVIGRALEQTRGNKTMAARALRMKRTTLVEKVKKFERATPAAAAG
jgi:transcriptional regulator with GAF, ATPase, and Fis domain